MKIWKSIAMFFAGVIAGFLLLLRTKKPDRVIHTENYTEDQEQNIGKIKQKGKDNRQKVELVQEPPALPTKKELRKEKKVSRKTKRSSRKTGN